MVNKKLLLGMLVLTLVFGMTVLGCEDDKTDGKGGGNTGSGGTFVVTDIPAEYNGKYAIYMIKLPDELPIPGNYTEIKNGQVSIQANTIMISHLSYLGYSGNETFPVLFYIVNDSHDYIAGYTFQSVTFSGWNARKSLSEGQKFY